MKDVQTDERTAFGFDINQACTDQLLQWVYPPLYPVHDPSTPWGKPDERGRCVPHALLAWGWHDGFVALSTSTGMACLAARACLFAACMWPCSGRALCACLIYCPPAVWACSPSVWVVYLSASQCLMRRLLGLCWVLLDKRTFSYSK